jgi:uncharacterized protein YecT (DUF1311 family)
VSDLDRARLAPLLASVRRTGGVAGLLLVWACPPAGRRDAPAARSSTEAATAATAIPTAAATLSAIAAPPPPVSPESVLRGDDLAVRAERCLADPRCSAAEAARLYQWADDAGATKVSCFRFYHGSGVPADAARARACFERAVGRERGWEGSSPSLDRVFLGLMLLDGQGGPRDRARGEALFTDCYLGNDSGVGIAAEARERSGSAKPIDFCEDLGGTTLDTNACAQLQGEEADVNARLAAKEIAAALAIDDAGLALLRKADGAWGAFAADEATYVGDAYRGGSMRIAQESWLVASLARERVEVLRALLAPKPAPRVDDREIARAEARAGAEARDADNRRLLGVANASWRAYRAAEVAFVRHAFARKHGGEAEAARALGAELAQRRVAALDAAVRTLRGE